MRDLIPPPHFVVAVLEDWARKWLQSGVDSTGQMLFTVATLLAVQRLMDAAVSWRLSGEQGDNAHLQVVCSGKPLVQVVPPSCWWWQASAMLLMFAPLMIQPICNSVIASVLLVCRPMGAGRRPLGAAVAVCAAAHQARAAATVQQHEVNESD